MLTINQLMKYLRNHHSISVKSNQAQSLRNIGYYHGYKGYRFIRNPNSRIPFSSLDEVIALNNFDMQLKTKKAPYRDRHRRILYGVLHGQVYR